MDHSACHSGGTSLGHLQPQVRDLGSITVFPAQRQRVEKDQVWRRGRGRELPLAAIARHQD